MSESIRTFIAIPLPDPLLAELTRLQDKLERETPPNTVRWVRPEGIHLTLKFLGDTPVEKLPQIRVALAAVARNGPTATCTVSALGCFPNPRRPRVIWVGLQEPTGRLAVLQDAIEQVVAPFGYPPEGRGFTPHLTLGRVNKRAHWDDVARVGEIVATTQAGELGQIVADHFALIQSVLKPSGAEYEALARFELGEPHSSSTP